LFVYWQETSSRVAKYLHTLYGRESFVGIVVNVILKGKFLVKEKSKIFLYILRFENRASRWSEFEWWKVSLFSQSREIADLRLVIFNSEAKFAEE